MKYYQIINSFPQLFSNDDNAPLQIITDHERIALWQAEEKKRLESRGLPTSWADIGIILEDPYIMMVRDLVQFPDGNIRGYIRLINRADIEGGQGVAVLPYMGGEFLLLHQYRHATRSWHLEIPRGFGEPGVDPINQAIAEIWEEVKGELDELTDLGELHANSGMESCSTKIYYAKLRAVGSPEQSEGIRNVEWVTLPELENYIETGTITDSFSIAAYVRAKLRGIIT
ncbi:MAG: NUDIX hydrolase [Anaerolineales bacterium]|nr:NUDIX hydrolase [Anaerolineales bacterium]